MAARQTLTWIFLASVLTGSGLAQGAPSNCGEAPFSEVYELEFIATWSRETHPQDFPFDNPHFTGPVGGTHNAAYTVWQPGGIATQGIETVAERGVKDDLIAEVEAQILLGNAGEVISGTGIFPSPGQRSTSFTATQDFPLASVVSMVAPSPDWFVGVSAVALFANGAWVDEVVVPLYITDAGTDAGKTYRTPDHDITPHIPISMIDHYPMHCGSLGLYPTPFRPFPCLTPGEILPAGSFTFRRSALRAASCIKNTQ